MLPSSRLKDGTDLGVVIKELEAVDIITVTTKQFSTLNIQHLGRVLIASKDFQVGDLVLRESPLVWFSDSQNLIRKFVSEMTETDKRDMLGMFHFNSPKDTTHELCKRSMYHLAEDTYRIYMDMQRNNQQVSMEEIFQCLSIVNLNAHSFYPNEREPNRAALFPIAAIISHSCQPNTIYAIEQSCIEYYATRPILRGEEITSTYLSWSDLVTCHTAQRRQKLLASKDFICLCARCKDIDLFRGVSCRSGLQDTPSRCRGVTYPTSSSSSSSSTIKFSSSSSANLTLNESWRCVACNSTKKSVLTKVEQDLEEEYNSNLQHNDSFTSSGRSSCIDELDLLVDVAAQQLSPTHSLVVRILLSLVALYVEEARSHDSSDYYTAREYRLLAVQRLGQFVRTMECIEARCVHVKACLLASHSQEEVVEDGRPSNGLMHHAPAVFAVKEVMDIWCHLTRCHVVPPDWLSSYIPLLAVFYGEKNSLVSSFGLAGDDQSSSQDFREYCKQS